MKTIQSVEIRERPLSWLAMTLTFTITGLLLLVALAWFFFGSLGSAMDYLKGDRLMVERASISFGEVEKGRRLTILFKLFNASNQPIIILGARTTCTCLFVQEMPCSIPPRSRHSIKLAVTTDSREGLVEERIRLFTDFAAQPEVALRILGRILNSDHRER